ncbi:hypothetical protein [Streptomyces sp. NPDC057428]|uniref:hypothetical protein n=1 Tax=Streptomyces sp. NPDC057428 TaxID=3346129 RepID=UPI0036B947C2
MTESIYAAKPWTALLGEAQLALVHPAETVVHAFRAAVAGPGPHRTHRKERPAAYKYPREVEILTELPKTASGKILRRELRSPR